MAHIVFLYLLFILSLKCITAPSGAFTDCMQSSPHRLLKRCRWQLSCLSYFQIVNWTYTCFQSALIIKSHFRLIIAALRDDKKNIQRDFMSQ